MSPDGEGRQQRQSGSSLCIQPLDSQPGQRVTLLADPGVPTKEIETLRWDLDGNGEPDTQGRSVSYSFPEDGQFPVSLTVERKNGTVASIDSQIPVGNATVETTAYNTANDETTGDRSTDGPRADTTSPTETDGAGGPGMGLAGSVVAIVAVAVLFARRAKR